MLVANFEVPPTQRAKKHKFDRFKNALRQIEIGFIFQNLKIMVGNLLEMIWPQKLNGLACDCVSSVFDKKEAQLEHRS